MKAYFLCTSTGPDLILTSCDYIKTPQCLRRLADSGISKFIAHEVPLDLLRERYGSNYVAVMNDPKETDELRTLDTDGEHILNNLSFTEMGPPIYYERVMVS